MLAILIFLLRRVREKKNKKNVLYIFVFFFFFFFQGKSRVKEVYSQLTTYMIAQGMQDIELFALAFILGESSVQIQ